jgi:quercetin dioxygenase-like cupin family protein
MDAFEVDEVFARLDTSDHDYAEFFRAASGKLSMTIAFWPAGGDDPQRPHTEDEVYYVVAGSGQISVGDEVRDVRAGSIVFVAAGVPHRFHDITSELTLLVVFGPAEGSRS